MTKDKKKTKKFKKQKHESECVLSGNTLALELDKTVHVYSIIFIAIYLLRSSPLQKCVLTLDDVMLQVQRIYVNRGFRGGGGMGRKGGVDGRAGGRVKSFQTLQDLFTHKNEKLLCNI